MRDVYPPTHWAIRGEPPAYDTPDEDVYLEGRNVVLLSKASVFMARARIPRVLIGPLSGNPFPDATPAFFDAMARALSIGLAAPIAVEAPFVAMSKADVIRLGRSLNVPFELTLSCMQPRNGRHCGRCSKCRERLEAFQEVGAPDPAAYADLKIRFCGVLQGSTGFYKVRSGFYKVRSPLGVIKDFGGESLRRRF